MTADPDYLTNLGAYLLSTYDPSQCESVVITKNECNNLVLDIRTTPAPVASTSNSSLFTCPPHTSNEADATSPAHKKLLLDPVTPVKSERNTTECNDLSSNVEGLLSPSKNQPFTTGGLRPHFHLTAKVILGPFFKEVDMIDLRDFLNKTAILYGIVSEEGTSAVRHIEERSRNASKWSL
ncbi:uncharacterized protein LOC117642939 [Thrips palmi]|uniref:Uncharacterized protein LOC117642939 n=1 Tax=Thrips palmi TaxID=161013 RepID=A0A6P8YTR5_THRPL|nr:uncharacterized protein LOC117642939 [Thrips palmi]